MIAVGTFFMHRSLLPPLLTVPFSPAQQLQNQRRDIQLRWLLSNRSLDRGPKILAR
jgi:hypothetical protein